MRRNSNRTGLCKGFKRYEKQYKPRLRRYKIGILQNLLERRTTIFADKDTATLKDWRPISLLKHIIKYQQKQSQIQ